MTCQRGEWWIPLPINFDARLLCFLDVLLVTFLSLFSNPSTKSSIQWSIGSRVLKFSLMFKILFFKGAGGFSLWLGYEVWLPTDKFPGAFCVSSNNGCWWLLANGGLWSWTVTFLVTISWVLSWSIECLMSLSMDGLIQFLLLFWIRNGLLSYISDKDVLLVDGQ